MKLLLKKILLLFKPLVWRVAELFDIQVNRPYFPYGSNKVLIEDNETKRVHNIPKTVYFNTGSGDIYVGANTQFGERVQLLTGMHMHKSEADKLNLPPQSVPKNGRDIVIGNDCFIGGHVIIIGPVKIGNGVIIGAGSIVTKDVPDNSLVVGPTAQLKKRLV